MAIKSQQHFRGGFQHIAGTIIRCDDEQLPCYSGGQFELGIGRTQVQEIASLCFPGGPNDCAPVLFADCKAVVVGAAHAGWPDRRGCAAPTWQTAR